MDYDEKFEHSWENEKHNCIEYLKNDVLCTAFGLAIYSKKMEMITGSGTKNSLSLPSIGWNFLNSIGEQCVQTFYTYKDNYMRRLVRRNIKGSRCAAFNQIYKSRTAGKVFGTISVEFNWEGNFCKVIDAYLKA